MSSNHIDVKKFKKIIVLLWIYFKSIVLCIYVFEYVHKKNKYVFGLVKCVYKNILKYSKININRYLRFKVRYFK